jgi:hypothetical protein
MGLSFIEGNEAVALGAVAAGCQFFAGYPITPATTIYNAMLKYLPPRGGVCLQGEDEIASIGYCLGASMAGQKVLTATSGPGISLYSEQISFAIGSEIPLVIVNVQRLGPSTGSATKGADGDIQFMRWGSSSGLPVIVLAPVDVTDCYRLTAEAFNLAEQYRCPVFLASNKEIAMTRESVDLDAIELPAMVDRQAADREIGGDTGSASRWTNLSGAESPRAGVTIHPVTGTQLTFYYREDCHLCEVMLRALQGLQQSLRFELALIDIDRNPAVARVYNERVPVLCRGKREICRYRLDEARLRMELER